MQARLRAQRRLFLLVFCALIIILVFSIYHAIVDPYTYSLPKEQSHKPLWEAGYARKYRENREYWKGTEVCNADPQRGATDRALRFREDGSFRIAIFTDLHFSCGHTCAMDQHSQLLVDSILEIERPDLVVFNGDLVQAEGGQQKPAIFLDIFAPVERRGIPFAVIFGNHDSDGPYSLSRDKLVRLAYQCPHSITMSPSEYERNEGNYIRVLKGDSTTTHLLFLDTNRDSLSLPQVNWLRDEMVNVQSAADDIFATLVFMHIPSKEFIMKMCTKDSVCNGMYGEKAEFGGKTINTGFYDAFQTFQGSVRAIFSGHDHKNDVCSVAPSDFGDPTEVLCYARASGYGGYGHNTLAKGSRIVHINEKTNSLFTYVVDESGERTQVLHFIQHQET